MSGHSHSRPALAELTARLRQRDRRITGPRQLVLDLLRQEEHPLSVRQIHEQLDCDLATVYRSLRLLEEMAMVKRFDFGDGDQITFSNLSSLTGLEDNIFITTWTPDALQIPIIIYI